jgi:hypothetical protein
MRFMDVCRNGLSYMRDSTDVDWAYQNQLREQWLKDNPDSEYEGWMSI